MDLIISSPIKNVEYHNIKKVTLPSTSGKLQILSQHAEMFLLLEDGLIFFTNSKNYIQKISLESKAQCYIKDNKIIILV